MTKIKTRDSVKLEIPDKNQQFNQGCVAVIPCLCPKLCQIFEVWCLELFFFFANIGCLCSFVTFY